MIGNKYDILINLLGNEKFILAIENEDESVSVIISNNNAPKDTNWQIESVKRILNKMMELE